MHLAFFSYFFWTTISFAKLVKKSWIKVSSSLSVFEKMSINMKKINEKNENERCQATKKGRKSQ